MNQQQQNHRLRTDSTVDLNAFYWYHIFAQDSVAVKTQNVFSSQGGFLFFTMYVS